MQLIEWEVSEDGYEEQINIPQEQRELAAEEGISTDVKQKVTVRIFNLLLRQQYVTKPSFPRKRESRIRLDAGSSPA